MSNLISRQQAIDAMAELQGRASTKAELKGISKAWKRIKQLPSAQPDRKRGKWIEDGYNHYKAVCSECGEPCATYVMNTPRDRFCKWCGADMRQGGEQDG